jgi:hypothetical protein
MSAVRNKIYAQVQKDCEGAAKAFQKQCMVNALTFNDPRGEDSEGPSIVSGHAELTLYGDNKVAAPRAPR